MNRPNGAPAPKTLEAVLNRFEKIVEDKKGHKRHVPQRTPAQIAADRREALR